MQNIISNIIKEAKWIIALKDEEWRNQYVTHITPSGLPRRVMVKSLPPEEQEKYNPNRNKSKKPTAEDLIKHHKPPDLHSFFTKDEKNLPEVATQPDVKNEDDFYHHAAKTHDAMLDVLDRGKGLDKVLGAKHYDKFYEGIKALDKPGSVILTAPLKGKDRAREKVETDYHNDWSKLTDGVRASVVLDNLNDIHTVLNHLKKNGIELARKPKNRFLKPTDSGYRDMLLNIKYPNGHVGELQIHTKPMLKAKENFTHKYYEEARSLDAKRKKENRAFTPEEQQQVDDLDRKAKDIHDKAWMDSIKSLKKQSKTKLIEKPEKYFHMPKGTKLVPLKDIETIRTRPTGIENAEKHMLNAYNGDGEKRKPISVIKSGNKWKVFDGNSTTAIAKKHNWNSIPVLEVDENGNYIREATKTFMNKQSLSSNIYFEYNDFSAIWEKPNYPVVYKHGKTSEPKSIMDWVLNRRTISKAEFDKLMKIHGGHHHV